jgi:hypothetical protein
MLYVLIAVCVVVCVVAVAAVLSRPVPTMSLSDVDVSVSYYAMRTGWAGSTRVVCVDRADRPHYRVGNHIQNDYEDYLDVRIMRDTTLLSDADLSATDYVHCTKYGVAL